MSAKREIIGEVVDFDIYGEKAILIPNAPRHGVTVKLPAKFNSIKVGMLAYFDENGQIRFCEDGS